MSRKDTIIIAVIVNAALLIGLFIGAIKKNQEKPAAVLEKHEPMPIKLVEPKDIKAASGDEVDQILKDYAASKSDSSLSSATHVMATPKTDKPEGASPTLTTPAFASFEDRFSTSPSSTGLAPLLSTTLSPSPTVTSEVIVKKGDVLEKIAKQHKMSVDELMKLNQLTHTNLRIGQVLKVNHRSAPTNVKTEVANTAKATNDNVYVVKNGDNPWTIAVKNHMKVDELLRLNNLDEEKARKLKPGDKLRIR